MRPKPQVAQEGPRHFLRDSRTWVPMSQAAVARDELDGLSKRVAETQRDLQGHQSQRGSWEQVIGKTPEP